MSVYELELGSIKFVNHLLNSYEIIDGSLEVGEPQVISESGFGEYDIPPEQTYASRTVSWEYRIVGDSRKDALDKLSAVNRLLDQATRSSRSGNTDTEFLFYSSPFVSGVPLKMKIGEELGDSMVTELGANVNDDRVYYFNVLSGSQQVGNLFSVQNFYPRESGEYIIANIRINLTCAPFANGAGRLIFANSQNFTCYNNVQPDGLNQNRVTIYNSQLDGDAPGVIRLSTDITGGDGVIMGRDIGPSMVNSPSYPVQTVGTGLNDIVVFGENTRSTALDMAIKITSTATPNTFAVSTDGGSLWGSNIPIEKHKAIEIYSNTSGPYTDKIYVMFINETGHTINNRWDFRTHQLPVALSGSAVNVNADSSYYSESGAVITSTRLNVPPGCVSRYKMLASITEGQNVNTEYKAEISFGSLSFGETFMRFTRPISNDWYMPPHSALVDLGVIDVTPSANTAKIHPGAIMCINVTIRARANRTVTGTNNVTPQRLYLIPCPDDHSFFMGNWAYDYSGREVFCNYDLARPYIAEASATVMDTLAGDGYEGAFAADRADSLTYSVVAPLDVSYTGSIPTLIPGYNNTLVIMPTFTGLNVNNDYTKMRETTATMGGMFLSYMPRYNLVG